MSNFGFAAYLAANCLTIMKKLLLLTLILGCTAVLSRAADATALWKENCAKCHGESGKGDTRMGKKAGVKDYTDPKVQASFTDAQAFKSIKEGVKEDGKEKMKGYGDKLSDQDINALVAHIRTFKK